MCLTNKKVSCFDGEPYFEISKNQPHVMKKLPLKVHLRKWRNEKQPKSGIFKNLKNDVSFILAIQVLRSWVFIFVFGFSYLLRSLLLENDKGEISKQGELYITLWKGLSFELNGYIAW